MLAFGFGLILQSNMWMSQVRCGRKREVLRMPLIAASRLGIWIQIAAGLRHIVVLAPR
jgi:hypothetical protein